MTADECDSGKTGTHSRTSPRQASARDRTWPKPRPGPAREPHRFLIRPDRPNPQSQSLSRSYGSDLPTSLTYIVLSTRGCSPRRPAADMGTNWCDTPVSFPWIFKVRWNTSDTTITAALFAILTLSLREGIPGRSIAHAEKITLPEGFNGFSRSF